jgi:predicted dehydrogenase
MSAIPVGIIGLGHNGLEHLRAHLALGKSEIVALCDRNPARLAEAGALAPGAACYAEMDAFFRHPGLEAVSINTGDAFHGAPFLAAMTAGLHVLCEKPLGNSEAEIRAMAAAVRPGLKIQVGYILRFNPVFARLHALAREGEFGDIYYLEGDYIHNLLYQAQQTDAVTGKNWYLDEEIPMVGGGSHPLDLLRWISGKEVTAVWTYGTHAAYPAMRHDDCQVALYRFADGSIAKTAALYAPRCGMAPYYNLRAYGTLGTIERDTMAIAQDAEDVHPPFVPVDSERVTGHGYTPEIEDWLDAIRDNRTPRCPFADGANSTLAALCAVRAAAEGREVAVADVREWLRM